MASKSYKLRCSFIGHEKDVRSVCPAYFPSGAVLSSSRDITSKLWIPNDNESDLGFSEAHCMSGHSGFVMCVAVVPPDESYPHGQIVTGGLDHNILAYTLDSPKPIYMLDGHGDCVSSLAPGKFGTLLSGSWDKTAKVWLNKKCVMTLEGHEAAIWAVAVMPEGGFMLTGSADKTIKMWKAGRCERTFTGHQDCVRGLAVMSSTEFLSCSNDATVRHWLTSGDCLRVLDGHNNFIYDISLLPNGRDFVSVGEDRSLRVWRDEECHQTITHPCTSVWCVAVLCNGDIVTGSSDGVIRIFTTDPSLMANEEEQTAFEKSIADSKLPSQIGDIKMEDLPGPEALLNPGKRDGQTLMVRNGSNVEAHQWSAGTGSWKKIGDVVGGSGGSQESSGKQLFQGKEYDYVFDVDLSEGHPPLKLPFNITEDPWMAAHNFLARNDLDQMFLDQVANFIMNQTKGITLGHQPQGSYQDPFTGAGRYVPGSTDVQNSNNQMGYQTGVDPFTGASSYQSERNKSNPYFPKTSYLLFDQANTSAIMGKLKEHNSKVPQSLLAEEITSMENLMTLSTHPTDQQQQILYQLLQWPDDFVYPVLDILRLCILNQAAAEKLLTKDKTSDIINILLPRLSVSGPAANQILALRILSNTFKFETGKMVLLARKDDILSPAVDCKKHTNRNVQIALTSLVMNYCVTFKENNDVEGQSHCVRALAEVMEGSLDAEAIFRCLVSLGTLVYQNDTCTALAMSLGLGKRVDYYKSQENPNKILQCATSLLALLQ